MRNLWAKTMRTGKIVLLMLGATVLIFAIVIAILWSMTSILELPYEQAIPLLGAIGAWVAGLGTLGAAGIALWLARRTEKIRMRCVVNLYVVLYGEKQPTKYCMGCEVTNLGILHIIVDAIGWSIGTGNNKKYGTQNIFRSPYSDSLPKRLEYGESANFRVLWKEEEMKIWMRNLVEMFDITFSNIETLRARIYTTTGHVETVKPSKDFMKELAEAINSEHPSSTE